MTLAPLRHTLLALALSTGLTAFAGAATAQTTLLNVSYDPTRELYQDFNPEFAKLWREHYPSLKMYTDSAANIAELCRKEGVQQLDVVFSGLPWASFPEELQREILDATLPMLKPGGKLITFA